jgi:hypothetical protein
MGNDVGADGGQHTPLRHCPFRDGTHIAALHKTCASHFSYGILEKTSLSLPGTFSERQKDP